jgi:3-oxoacyl-[acyl-carrier protein] reductase
MGTLEGKTALITGASRGIGRAIAKRFADEGAQVIVNYATNRAAADSVVGDIEKARGRAFAVQADVSDLAAIASMFEEIKRRVDGLDILVNNAGRGGNDAPGFEAVTPADYDATFGLNARGLFFVTQHAVKTMRNGGRVINISSMAPHVRYAALSTYAASKATVDSFTRSLATELAVRQITVNAICCGIIETEMTAHLPQDFRAMLLARTPLGRLGQTGDISDIAAFLASDESRWISGAEIPAAGGYYF